MPTMPTATTANTKTVKVALSPHFSAATLTDLLAKAIEEITVAELHALIDALRRLPGGSEPKAKIGELVK